MLWAVDKKIVRYMLERDGQLVEIPIRQGRAELIVDYRWLEDGK